MKKELIICIIIIIFLCVFFYTRSNLENEYTELDNYNMLQNETNIEQEQEDISKIFIHVTGAVNNEGVVEIKEGSRIADAVDAANGFTEDADISQINLAYQLEDGQKIYIPRINDEKINGEEKVLQKEYVTDEAGDDIIIEDETLNIKSKENAVKYPISNKSFPDLSTALINLIFSALPNYRIFFPTHIKYSGYRTFPNLFLRFLKIFV